jgi:hypothetical protein
MARRVNVRQASALLRISEGAVRQRIARGTLQAERDADGSVYVVLPDESSRDTSEATTGYTSASEASGASVEAELRDRLRYVERQLEQERESNRENRRLLAAALERIPAIEAPPETQRAPESAEGPSYGTSPQEAQDSLQRRPSWWRKFFGFE